MLEWIKVNGERENKYLPKGKKKFSLSELQGLVGGYIEAIHLTKDLFMIVDEEGRIKGKGVNQEATKIMREFLGQGTVEIVGDVVVIGKGDF